MGELFRNQWNFFRLKTQEFPRETTVLDTVMASDRCISFLRCWGEKFQ